MGKHSFTHDSDGGDLSPREITIDRIVSAVETLGFVSAHSPDRVVIPAYGFISTLWIKYEKPLTLVADCVQRIPIESGSTAQLSRFLNEWNRDKFGPAASCRLMDSGDTSVHMRYGVCVQRGISRAQLLAECAETLDCFAAFCVSLREDFLPVEFDQPLPPALMRAQDVEQLLGRHPCERHLPRGAQAEVDDVPDFFVGSDDDLTEEVTINAFEKTFETLGFAYALTDVDVISTAVNGVPIIVSLDGEKYARVTALWDTGVSEKDAFLALWLICNDYNEKSAGVGAYLENNGEDLELHTETSCVVSQGLTAVQRDSFVISSIISILGAIDDITTQFVGSSPVSWPRPGDG